MSTFKQILTMMSESGQTCPVTSRPVFLGIDVGTSNTKLATVAVDDGVVRELAVTSTPTPDTGDELLDRLAESIARIRSDADHVVAVGIASMAETGVLQRSDGATLGALLRWDAATEPAHRTDAELVASELDASGLRERTGVPHTHKAPLSTWAVLQRGRDERWLESASWNGVADFVGRALTGRNAMDHTLAARTMAFVLDPTGPPEGRLDPDILAGWGLDASRFPRVLPPGAPLGVVHAVAARRFGLPAGASVSVAGHDHAVAAWAAGLRTPGRSVDSVGTAEAVIGLVRSDRVDTDLRRRAIDAGVGLSLAVDGTEVAVTAGSAASGGLVRLLLSESPAERRTAILEEASRLAVEPGPIARPYPRGRQSPAPDRYAVLDIPGSLGGDVDRLAAVLRGLAHHARWMFDTVDALAPANRATVVAGGPAVASPSWRSLRAQVFEHELERLTVREPVAVGAALLAAARSGSTAPPPPLPTVPIDAASAAARGSTAQHRRRHDDFVRSASLRSGHPQGGSTTPAETGGS
jgi:xylulokinase